MARNAEKAMSAEPNHSNMPGIDGTTLARWRAAQLGESEQTKVRRPYLASECTDLPQAEKWRMQIIREIARKVSQIQNAGLGEFRIRDLNDEINKLLREKGHWETQIRELGGPDYSRSGPKMLDSDGKEVPGNRGYKYFGAARQLPGVKELFEQAPPPPPHKSRGELMRDIDAVYYGYMDDEDGVLIPLELEEETIAVKRAVAEWTAKKELSLEEPGKAAVVQTEEDDDDPNIYKVDTNDESDEDEGGPGRVDPDNLQLTAKSIEGYKAHIPVPSQKEVEAVILEMRKQNRLHPEEERLDEDEEEAEQGPSEEEGGKPNTLGHEERMDEEEEEKEEEERPPEETEHTSS